MTRDRISLYIGPAQEINNPNDLGNYENGCWVAERKYDGIWCLIETNDKGYITRLSTRTGVTIKDYNILGTNIGIPKLKLAAEYEARTDPSLKAIRKRGWACLYIFDIMQMHGQDTTIYSQEQRAELVTKICDLCKEIKFIHRAEQKLSNFKDFFYSCMNDTSFSPTEGLVLKRLDKPYKSEYSNGKVNHWIRVKLQRTVDLYVMSTGYTESRALNLIMGQWKNGRMVEIQSMSVPKGFRAKELVGCIIECTYDRQHDSGRYRHLRFKRVRNDKTMEMTG